MLLKHESSTWVSYIKIMVLARHESRSVYTHMSYQSVEDLTRYLVQSVQSSRPYFPHTSTQIKVKREKIIIVVLMVTIVNSTSKFQTTQHVYCYLDKLQDYLVQTRFKQKAYYSWCGNDSYDLTIAKNKSSSPYIDNHKLISILSFSLTVSTKPSTNPLKPLHFLEFKICQLLAQNEVIFVSTFE